MPEQTNSQPEARPTNPCQDCGQETEWRFVTLTGDKVPCCEDCLTQHPEVHWLL